MTRIATNPFYVLGLRPDAPRAIVEREGQRLIATIELGLAGAGDYDTPVGRRTRDAHDVRRALAELRDPERRAVHELWAVLAPDARPEPNIDVPGEPEPWPEALWAFGWRS